MTCCSIRFRVRSPEKIKFKFSVTGYKDRIVAPETYTGETVVTAGENEVVLQTHNKLVESDIRVNAITGVKTITENGTYDTLGDKEVTVSITPDLRPLSVAENGTYEPDGFDGYSIVTADIEPNLESLSVTENGLYLPTAGVDGYDRVTVNVPQPSGGIEITENGTYDVTDYVSAVVNVTSKIGTLIDSVTLDTAKLYVNREIPTLFNLNTGEGVLYYAVFENNTRADGGNAVFMYYGTGDTAFSYLGFRQNWEKSSASQTGPLYASAGTTIKLYQLPLPLPT